MAIIYRIWNETSNGGNIFAVKDHLDESDRTESNASSSGKRPSQRTSGVKSRCCLSWSRAASTSTSTARGTLARGKRSRWSSRRAGSSLTGLVSSSGGSHDNSSGRSDAGDRSRSNNIRTVGGGSGLSSGFSSALGRGGGAGRGGPARKIWLACGCGLSARVLGTSGDVGLRGSTTTATV